jgi:hypothetical protein
MTRQERTGNAPAPFLSPWGPGPIARTASRKVRCQGDSFLEGARPRSVERAGRGSEGKPKGVTVNLSCRCASGRHGRSSGSRSAGFCGAAVCQCTSRTGWARLTMRRVSRPWARRVVRPRCRRWRPTTSLPIAQCATCCVPSMGASPRALSRSKSLHRSQQ